MTGLSFPGGFGADREVSERHAPRPGLRSQLSELTDILRERDSGVLITVDEVAIAVQFCLDSPSVTGQGIEVDGGAVQS